jgi:COP9 signalosome complex subunit 1
MRIAFFELGQIHYNFGFLNEAIKAWTRSHDFSTSEEDLFNVSSTIAQASFENQVTAYLSKYAGEADARDKGKNPTKTMQIKILDALASLAQSNYKDAAIKLTSVSIIDESSLSAIARPKDLAFYAIICSLNSMSRAEIKSQILTASGFKNLMEMAGSPSTEDVIENFLNGRYMDFQRQIVQITSQMKFDLYFGRRLDQVISEIRRKALVQYVSPYKVIDMREIAKAFDLTVERVELEIA